MARFLLDLFYDNDTPKKIKKKCPTCGQTVMVMGNIKFQHGNGRGEICSAVGANREITIRVRKDLERLTTITTSDVF